MGIVQQQGMREVDAMKLWLTVFGFLTLPPAALIVITGWLI